MHKKSFSLLQGGQSSQYRNQRFWKYIFPFIVVSYLTGKVLHTRKNLILLNDILNWIYLQITAQGSFLHKSIHGDTTAQTFYLFWSSWRHLSPSPLKYFIIQTAQGPFLCLFFSSTSSLYFSSHPYRYSERTVVYCLSGRNLHYINTFNKKNIGRKIVCFF